MLFIHHDNATAIATDIAAPTAIATDTATAIYTTTATNITATDITATATGTGTATAPPPATISAARGTLAPPPSLSCPQSSIHADVA